jgi:hypothetical protein
MNNREYQPPKSIDDYRKRVADYMSEKDKEKLEKHKNRFFTKVNKNGPLFVEPSITYPEINNTHCWEWTGALSDSLNPEKAYGIFDNPKYSRLAHRESYMLHNEGIVEDVPRQRSIYRITKVDVETGKPLEKSKEMTREDIESEFGVGKRAIAIAIAKTKEIGYVRNVPGKMKTKFHGYRVKDLGTRILTYKTRTGKVLDHKCNNRRCVNPSHLHLTTRRGNNAHTRAEGRNYSFKDKKDSNRRPRAATCPSGHGRENMQRWPNGNEYCKLCYDRDKSRRVKKYRDLKKIAQLSKNQSPPGPL